MSSQQFPMQGYSKNDKTKNFYGDQPPVLTIRILRSSPDYVKPGRKCKAKSKDGKKQT